MSDEWKSYRRLDQNGYIHDTVNHSENFINPENPEVHTQTIESIWNSLKSKIKKKGRNLKVHLEEYLLEYIYRKKFGENFFEQLIIDISKKYNFS